MATQRKKPAIHSVTNQPQPMSESTTTRPVLARETAVEMASALASMAEIKGRTIKLKDDEANLRAAETFLLSHLVKHASELLGCYFAIKDEYEPLVGIYARLQQRATAINMSYLRKAGAPSPEIVKE